MAGLLERAKNRLPKKVRTFAHYIRYVKSDRSALNSIQPWNIPFGFDRIYLYHVRKTAGTSLGFAFMNIGGSDFLGGEKEAFLNEHGWFVNGGYVFVSHNPFLLERGEYFFGDSHLAVHEIAIPENTFKITMLRDPAARVMSYYRMLRHWEDNDIAHPARAIEGRYVGGSFADFLDRVPREHLLRQLYMFSSSFDVDEAVENLARMNFILSTENYREHLAALGSLLELDLRVFSEKAGYGTVTLSEDEQDQLRRALEPEYALMAAVAPSCGIYRRPGSALVAVGTFLCLCTERLGEAFAAFGAPLTAAFAI